MKLFFVLLLVALLCHVHSFNLASITKAVAKSFKMTPEQSESFLKNAKYGLAANAAYNISKSGAQEASGLLADAAKAAGKLISKAETEAIIKSCESAGNLY